MQNRKILIVVPHMSLEGADEFLCSSVLSMRKSGQHRTLISYQIIVG